MPRKPRQPESANIAISVLGAGPDADTQTRALRGIDGVEAVRFQGSTDGELLDHLATTRSDAVAFTREVPDLPGVIKRAVMAGRHVLVSTPVALASTQLLALDEVARRRGRVILFDACGLGDERLPFVRKMIGGAQPLWRPRYMRSLRTGARPGASLDEQVISDISLLLSLAGATPARVSAVAPRDDDETGAADVAMVTMVCDAGVILRCDVSLIEPYFRQEIAIACDGRTIVLDALDVRAPLQIQASARHRGPQPAGQWAETVSEHPVGVPAERATAAAAEFVRAVRSRDISATNARALATASLIWETARESISRGGDMVALPTDGETATRQRPEMRVIRGGGRRSTDRPAPDLTLVKRTPPRSA
jgi:predicted dehydrogenase